ncbi:hypothetical protein V6N13_053989 [Hibiscus sabdariffa]
MGFLSLVRSKTRLDYNQGRDEFFRSKIQKYQSTVFRTNMPPGPFISSLLTPRLSLYSTVRVSPFFSMCPKLRKKTFSPKTSEKGKSSFQTVNDQAGFKLLLCRAFFGSNPPDTKLGDDGPGLISKWVLLQLGPVLSLGLPGYVDVEELAIRTFSSSAIPCQKGLSETLRFFLPGRSGFVQDEAEKLALLPNMLKWIGRAGIELHTELASKGDPVSYQIQRWETLHGCHGTDAVDEIRCVRRAPDRTPRSVAVWGERRRICLIESHDAVYQVKEGEMLYGYQPFATKDPKIFEDGEEFVADRFMGDDGERLLKHVLLVEWTPD